MIVRKALALACALALAGGSRCLAFTADFGSQTPVVEAVRALAKAAGRNVVVSGELKGTVAMRMVDTTFDDALHAMSMAGGFSYEKLGDTVLVGPADQIKTMKTFKLKHLEPEAVAKQAGLLVEDDNVAFSNDAHTVSVTGSTAALEQIQAQIDELDTAQQQVTIKATVIELSKSKERSMGLSYLSDTWSKDTSIGGYNGFKFSITGAHEEVIGRGNVLARPTLTTFDGRKASLLMGDNVPVFTSSSDSMTTESYATMTVEYKEVGVKLDVTPRINDADKETVTMTIKPTVSTITEWVESGNNKAPQISERSAETTVRVKSGQTILIGGLLKSEEIKSIRAIPFLSKIPILGELFKSRSIDKNETEVVIAITPVIVKDEDGRPKVEEQTSTPKLHRKLVEMQSEPQEANVGAEAQAELDSRNAALAARNKELEALLAGKEKDLSVLKDDKEALERSLRRSNESVKSAIASLKAMGRGR